MGRRREARAAKLALKKAAGKPVQTKYAEKQSLHGKHVYTASGQKLPNQFRTNRKGTVSSGSARSPMNRF